jgi:hypothetical protein
MNTRQIAFVGALAVALTTSAQPPQYPQYQQVAYQPVVYQMAPAWTPVAPGSVPAGLSSNPTTTKVNKPNAGGVAQASQLGWPYVSESPRYPLGQGTVYTPAIVQAPPPTGQPIMSQTPIPSTVAPRWNHPTGAPAGPPIASVPQIPYTPPPATTPPPASLPPAGPPAVAVQQPTPPPVAPPQGPQATPVSLPADRRPDAPFVDDRMFVQGGKVWREYDISAYTAKFYPNDHPEEAVRKWLLSETGGQQAWHGSEVSSLAVSSQRVTVYHTPEMQARVADLLGRFVYYTPGELQARVQIVNVKHIKWRKELLPRLRPIDSTASGREVWLIEPTDANALLQMTTNGWNGELLADKQFKVANGQTAKGFWPTKDGGYVRKLSFTGGQYTSYRPAEVSTQDGVSFAISPLIAPDAATLELDLEVKASKLTSVKDVHLDAPGHEKVQVPEVATAVVSGKFVVPPGKYLLVSLGLVPSIQSRKGLLGRDKRDEVLVLVAVFPQPNNTIAGVAAPPRPQIAARIPVQTYSAKLSTPGQAPPFHEMPPIIP